MTLVSCFPIDLFASFQGINHQVNHCVLFSNFRPSNFSLFKVFFKSVFIICPNSFLLGHIIIICHLCTVGSVSLSFLKSDSGVVLHSFNCVTITVLLLSSSCDFLVSIISEILINYSVT